MQRHLFAVLGCLSLLAACSGPTARPDANPLLRIQREEELADSLANVIIMKDPVADDESTRKFIESEIVRAKESLAEAQRLQLKGASGPFIPVKESVEGWALYIDGMLYLSSDFHSRPGTDLHLYVSTVVDPRDVAFPDVTALDLGRIDYPYGAMALPVSTDYKPEELRSVVLWDAKLKRLHGFVQLSRRG